MEHYLVKKNAVNIPFEQWLMQTDIKTRHREWSIRNEMHAEANALRYLSADNTENCVLYTLYSPCDMCAKAIRAHGIKRIVYMYEYARGQHAIEMLTKAGVCCDIYNGKY